MLKVDSRDIVLVVDDSPDTLRMLTDAIEESGKTVLVARAGVQALSMIEKIKPDVILMDAVMPGMDGFETCRRLRQMKELTHVPIIFMTGLTETGDIIKGLEAGGVDYVTKPIVPEELLARIHVHLVNARKTHSAQAALDVFGRYLMAADRRGHVLWSTPQTVKLLSAALKDFATEQYVLPQNVQKWLDDCAEQKPGTPTESIALSDAGTARKVELSFIGPIGSDEFLLRLTEGDRASDADLLKRKLSLTQREAEVLLWIARGKSNRDIAEILDLSPRTVNKHLEQIYAKLGVENRASAAALAVRTLVVR
ncbi:DNA-binding response regulator [Pseudolabrys taiwanensis]|uniref:DNA-binding response regulator n=1 Tax=Pseudolabrys taiwanensis TaxID=331696 RepID=A0A345ZUQ9_9HYPH|nr:DNA-binding response regulator [Pseudolabrys taiwanensis]AXK80656.1 DNA-binding response regulator [Pseudolabrys taiwanensis]